MLKTAVATVTQIVRADAALVEARATDATGAARRVIAYPALTGAVTVGDSVLLNVTATALALGTGGYDFVMANLSHPEAQTFGEPTGAEHIIKARYTPFQHAVSAVEMMPEHEGIWERATDLRGTPVVVCELHSQVAAVCAGIKASRPDARVVYVYTDTAALPLAFSRLVPELKSAGLLDTTITCGQAFGGDYEAVSFASALIAADHICGADVIVVGQGPGNAGTGTRYGFSGIEQGNQLNTAQMLGGSAIAVLRVSEGDSRARHEGISHHSLTVMETIVSQSVTIAVPLSELTHFTDATLAFEYLFAEADTEAGLALLSERGVNVTTMGRTVAQDRAFFAYACAGGAVAAGRVAR
ncbi:MAG: DUF3866 family protein [Armatimonadetes bacterium]|nr:DUF3866 family protein [Armatimonadota bacterium]